MQQNLPTVFLSGTLPKVCRDALSDRFCLRDPVVLHSDLINEKLTYSVQEIIGENRLDKVQSFIHSNYENVPKILCICDTRGNAEGLYTKAIDGREAYMMHRGMEISEARMNLERFKTCKVKSILYCTAALGEGINIGGLNHLVVVGTAYSLLKLVQYSARAGRSGERGQCKVLYFFNDKQDLDINGIVAKEYAQLNLVPLAHRQKVKHLITESGFKEWFE